MGWTFGVKISCISSELALQNTAFSDQYSCSCQAPFSQQQKNQVESSRLIRPRYDVHHHSSQSSKLLLAYRASIILKNNCGLQEYYSSISYSYLQNSCSFKRGCLDYLCYQQINYLMKNQSTPFESMGQVEPEDLQDIFKLLTELDRSKPNTQNMQESSNRSQPYKRKDFDPPISEESQPQPVSITQKLPPKIKILHNSAKLVERSIKVQPLKADLQSSLNQQSNRSAVSVEEGESQVPIENDMNMEKENFLMKKSAQKFAEKNKIVLDLQRQLQQYQSKNNQRQAIFQQEKNKQKLILSKILRDGNLQAFKYYEYLQHIDKQRKKIIQEEIFEKNNALLKTFKEQESKYKPKKKIKNSQTMSLSDEEQQKLSEFMEKEKKHYFSVLGSKFQKEKQKQEGLSLSLNSKRIAMLSQQRSASLRKLSQMKEIQPLCLTKSSNSNVEEILAVDLEKCHQVRIQCIKFNPTTLNQQRTRIFTAFLQEFNLGKKIMSSSNHHIFNQKSNIFVSLSSISMTDDEILLINQCNHSYFSLQSFLKRIELGPLEQQFHIVRYIIRICLKGIQQINNQLNHDKFIILPFNLYFNEKWELKLSNIALNQLMFQHFRHILQEDDYFYFPPEEKPDKHSSSLWSLGILVYSLCFGGKPFQKYEPYHWNSRDQFFMFNQLQIPQKSVSYDKCKDFIMYCLNKKGSINFNQVCSQTFLTQVK